MWKRIGVKNDGSPQPLHSSLTSSPQATTRDNGYRRKMPLDEESILKRDLSSSRLSASSRDFNKITSESSMVLESLRNVQTKGDEEELLPIRIMVNGQNTQRHALFEGLKEEKSVSSRYSEKADNTSPKTKKSPTRPNVTFAEKLTTEAAALKSKDQGTKSERQLLIKMKNENSAESSMAAASPLNATNEYIDSIQNKLRQSRKVNIRYEMKIAEMKKMYGEMRKLIKDELKTLTGFSKDFMVYAAKEIVNQVNNSRKLEKSVLKQSQNDRAELEQRLDEETQKNEILKSELVDIKRAFEEALTKLNSGVPSKEVAKIMTEIAKSSRSPSRPEKVTADQMIQKDQKKGINKIGDKTPSQATKGQEKNESSNKQQATTNQRQSINRLNPPAKGFARSERQSSKEAIKNPEPHVQTVDPTPQKVRTHIRRKSGQRAQQQIKVQNRQVLQTKVLSKNSTDNQQKSKQSLSPPQGSRQKASYVTPLAHNKAKIGSEDSPNLGSSKINNLMRGQSQQKITPPKSASSSAAGNKNIAVVEMNNEKSQNATAKSAQQATKQSPKEHPITRVQGGGNYEESISTIMNAISKMRTSITDMSNCKQTLQEKMQAPERQRRVISRTQKQP